jgi:tetratricopeptide (TPR) repeat protein
MKLKRWHDAIADCDAAIKSDGAYFKAYARRAAAALETGADDDARRALDDLAAADAIEPGSKEIEKLRQRALRAVNDADRGKMKRMTISEVDDDEDDDETTTTQTTTTTKSGPAGDAGGDAASFIPSETFAGAKPGYYFRDDARGAGYYRDENGNRAETEPKTTTKTKTKTKAASAEKPTTNAFSFDKKKKTPTPATTATTPAEAAKARGNEHFKRKEFARAKAAYDEAMASDPGLATGFCNRAGARHHLRDYQGAEEDATRAIEIETAYSKAYHRRAAARRALGKNADALSDYDSAIETASAGGGGSNVADLKEEKASLIDDMKFEKLKPARQGPMVFEEIEDEAPEPVVEEEDLAPPPPEPWPTSTLTDDDDDAAAAAETTASSETETGRRRLAIEEDDSSDDEDDAPSASAAPAAPPKTPDSSSRRKIPIVEDDDDDDDDEATTTTTTTETRGKNGDGDGDGADADAAAKMKRTADDAFKRGDMRAACDLYTACLASASASSSSGGSSVAAVKVAALANRAAARLKLEDYAGAEKDASDVLEMDGAHVKAHHRRAAARVKLGRVHDALVDYAVVRKAFPRHKGVLAEIEEAEALAAAAPAPTPTPKPKPKPAAAAEPPSASAAEIAELKQKGNAAFVRGSHREAIEHYAAAVHLATRANDDKTAAILLANRAASRLKLGEYAAAREDASEAIARDPKYVKAYHRRAAARSGLKDFENALEDYEVIVRANPGSETLRNEVNACMQRAAEAMLGGMDLGSLSGGGGDRAASSASAKKAVVVEADSDDRRVLYTGPHTTPSAW